MNINIGLGLITLILAIFLGFLVFLHNRRSRANQLFSLSIFCIAIWTITVTMADFVRSQNSALFWTRLAIIGPAFIPSLFLYFCLIFPKEPKKRLNKIVRILLFLPSFVITSLSFSRWNVKEVKLEPWGTNFSPGTLYIFLLIFFLIYMGLSFLILYRKMKYVSEKQRLQIKYIFFGAILSTILGIASNLLLPLIGIGRASSFGPAATLIFFGLTGYAMVKKELFGIKILLTASFVVLIFLLLLLDILVFSRNIIDTTGKSVVLIIFSYFGYMLIKSVQEEIRQRKQIEKMTERLKRAYQELQKLDKAKSEFLSIASHQLRTPLTITKGYLSMIIEGSYGDLSPKIKYVAQKLFQTNEQLIKLVNNLLNISRIESGKIELDLQRFSPSQLIQETIEEIKPEAEAKGLFIQYQREESIPEIRADYDKIKQVLLNLLDNAIKYTEHGGIKVTTKKENGFLLIEITDTGIGMTKEDLNKIFDSFQRGEAGERLWTGGAGLGLYVAKKFVLMHNGKIWAQSEGKNKGSTFFVKIPINL